MKEIPEPYVKANQTGIVLFVILTAVFNQPYILLALWIIQVLGLLTGKNAFVLLAKPLLRVQGKPTQALELQRFNNVLAVLFLTLSLLFFALQLPVLGYIFAAMLFLAAFAALCGYCIGCTVYFQYKQFKARRRLHS
ncbi:hypothetical protein FHS19_004917 [Paenibacillus rhizosphaerae]|uniref:DUF4395 domain-containing protein n=1 Tax=Paenibacillus rhizosphaerae TaxID=297318 RepID=A0A839TU12_9BACL|nr:DUF4395 domain-containing protein [Paenibacillus rhizosphaerae]MBB3130212.1 hypothetical protein [Paenibacillus rhizosphaerae]